jgi:hypothetical protein
MRVVRSILLVCLTLMAGCASHPKPNFSADWNSRIGSYTYDQAVAELGRPVVSGESSEGKTAEWTIRKSSGVTFGIGVGQGFYGQHSAVGVGTGTSYTPPPSGEYLRLKFDKDDKLKEWSKANY